MSARLPILVVLAHPDDETFICGGALARYAALGHPITLIVATAGEMGRRLGLPPAVAREGLASLRRGELRAACSALGITDLRLLGLLDKTLDYYAPPDLAARIAPVLEEVRPATLITFHEEISGHPDHNAIGHAARIAWEDAGKPCWLYYPLWKEPRALVSRVGASMDRVTAFRVSGAAVSAKLLAFRAHRTQSAMLPWVWNDKAARRRLSKVEYYLQGSGPARPGEAELIGDEAF